MPPQGVERYIRNQTGSHLRIWRFNNRVSSLPVGKQLRLETEANALVHWSTDDWATFSDSPARSSGLGTCYVDLPVQHEVAGTRVLFTFYWPDVDHWENTDFTVHVVDEPNDQTRIGNGE